MREQILDIVANENGTSSCLRYSRLFQLWCPCYANGANKTCLIRLPESVPYGLLVGIRGNPEMAQDVLKKNTFLQMVFFLVLFLFPKLQPRSFSRNEMLHFYFIRIRREFFMRKFHDEFKLKSFDLFHFQLENSKCFGLFHCEYFWMHFLAPIQFHSCSLSNSMKW